MTSPTQLTTTNLYREPQGTLVIQDVNGNLGVTGIRGEQLFASVLMSGTISS